MNVRIDRRQLLMGLTGSAALVGLPTLGRRTLAAETLSGVEWGGSYIDAMKKIAEKQHDYELQWELHASGAAAILAKVKASWPNVPYDFIAAYDPVFSSMIKEGWAEVIDPAIVTNLATIPEKYMFKDSDGRVRNIPRSLSGHYFGYRSDISPIAIESIDDLFSPKLEGQICWPHPVQMSCLHIVALARHAGGDERNIEPGWQLMKELAKTGNIGRVVQSEVDFINSITSGETSVSFWHLSAWMNIAKNVPVVQITKKEGFTTYLVTTGYTVLASSQHKEAAMKFLNFTLSPENAAIYCEMVGEAPASTAVPVDPSMAHMVFSAEEAEKFTYLPDWAYLGEQLESWTKRWEQEIAPLL